MLAEQVTAYNGNKKITTEVRQVRFDINNYKGKYVMHCKTEDEAREFCDYIERFGIHYSTSKTFRDFNENTCYNFNFGRYSDKDYYKSNGYTILEWSDFKGNEFTKADLKDGMIIECANGNRYLILSDVGLRLEGHILLSEYTDSLEHIGCEGWTITKAYKSKCTSKLVYLFNEYNLTLIWERKEKKPEPVEMTLEEICEALGKEIKIVKK